jgi:pyridoxal/pyridoxine/pyridoxamine kinase
MKAALSLAAGYIAPNEWETDPRTCIECGTELESWQASRCQECVDKSLAAVVANSAKWATCDGVVMCADCPMEKADCEQYQQHLTQVGAGDDYGPNPWDGAQERIENILSSTQNHRGFKPGRRVYFMDGL